jgi:hypothetical protein
MASGRDVPHDLAHFVVEATLGLPCGFWGLVANGATFKSVVGRRRTQPGLDLIRAHRGALNAAEHLVNAHVAAWRTRAPTPAGPALDAVYARWQALSAGEELRLDWPVQRLPRVPRGGPRRPGVLRRPARRQRG